MPKINQEEYEMLKGLDDNWKWIARDNDNTPWIYTKKPRKDTWGRWQIKGILATRVDINLFQFIQWEDEKPYNIQELIEEYENDYKGSWEHAIEFSKEMRSESEETEVKNIEELKSWFEDDKLYVGEYVKHKINQLDEPETDYAYQQGFREGERQMSEYFEGITEEPSYAQVQKYLSEHGIEVVGKEPETVASVLDDFYKSLERMKKVLNMEVEELEE